MPANYVLLQRIELNASAASVTFANIPQTGYTDLKVVASARSDYNGAGGGSNIRDNLNYYFNGLAASGNWSGRQFYGIPGVVVGSGNYSSGDSGTFGYSNGAGNTANTFSSCELYIANYASSTFKSLSTKGASESNASSTGLSINAGLYSSTAAITSITIFSGNSSNLVAGSAFSLYGLAAVGTTPIIAPRASGGNITTDGTYWYHTFLATDVFTPATSLSCDYLVVAGGGGGGQGGGGGGAGGYLTSIGGSQLSATLGTAYTITVGAGGTGSSSATNPPAANQTNGTNSVFSSITATGGGKGGSYSTTAGANGGSGGGGADPGFGLASPSGQGNNGGVGTFVTGGGGGGAGAVGQDRYGTTIAGNGGNGLSNSISGTSVTYAGGGGGGNWTNQGAAGSGGSGGGGNGVNTNTAAGNGATNLGGGGGGSAFGQWGTPAFSNSGNGGSGIVIIRYAV